MLIVHAAWLPKGSPRLQHNLNVLEAASCRLFIWAEVPNTQGTNTIASNSDEDTDTFPLHPFTASAQQLGEAIGTNSLTEEYISPYHLLLPTHNGVPISPGVPATDSDCVLEVWQVRGFYSKGDTALRILSRLSISPLLASGKLVLAPETVYWIRAGQLAVDVLSTGMFLPDAEVDANTPGQILAYWSVLKSDHSLHSAIEELAKIAPPSTLAYLRTDRSFYEPTWHSPLELVEGFLEGIAHQAAVEWLQRAERQEDYREIFRPGRRLEQSRLGEYWLRALAGREPLDLPLGQGTKVFVQGIKDWQEPARDTSLWGLSLLAEPVSAPEEANSSLDAPTLWRLAVHISPDEDQSILLPSEWVCFSESAPPAAAASLPFDSKGKLEHAIARAAEHVPLLHRLQDSATPTDLLVSHDEMAELLTTPGEILERAGLRVRLSDSLSQSGRIKLKGTMVTGGDSQVGLLGLGSLIEFDWKIALGDDEIDPREFEKMVNMRLPVVKIRGRYTLLSSGEGTRVLEMLRRREKTPYTAAEVLHHAVEDGEDADVDLDIAPTSWLSQMLERLDGTETWECLSQPEGFHGTMRPYQLKGYSWLAFLKQKGIGACLADDMGLGKTIQVIALLLAQDDQTSTAGPCLIVCPTSVIGNWKRELQRFAPSLSIMVHHGATRPGGDVLADMVGEYDVVLTTYGITMRDQESLQPINWSGIILDEAQNIKNPHTKQARALRRLSSLYRIALTGTPVENNLTELWSIMHFLNPGYLGSLDHFRTAYVNPIERAKDAKSLHRLRRLIQPMILRRLKTDPAIAPDLPDKSEMKVYCGLTQEQAQLYQAVVTDIMERMDEPGLSRMGRRGLILSGLTRLKQIVDHPALFLKDFGLRTRSGKLDRLTEMLSEAIAEGEKSLIFTQYAQMGKYLQSFLGKEFSGQVLFLHGGVPSQERTRMVEEFQESSAADRPIFVLSLKAGGTGLNLTAATQVFHFDRWWNPAVENQATDRAFRIGQTRKVQVYKFICGGTLEERIDQLIESKKELAENVVGTGEGWLTELSTDEFRSLITLQAADLDIIDED